MRNAFSSLAALKTKINIDTFECVCATTFKLYAGEINVFSNKSEIAIIACVCVWLSKKEHRSVLSKLYLIGSGCYDKIQN